MAQPWTAVACALVLGLLGACAATPKLPPEIAAHPELAKAAMEPSVVDVHDPIEGLNRSIYHFNAGFDRYLFLPIVRAYEFVTPDFIEDRISSFFANLSEVTTFANALLQLKGETAGRAATRFVVNSLFTAGLFDLAGARGIAQIREDFGQTLGHWGAGDGPFLVLPVLGPSNLRDTTGVIADTLSLWLATPNTVTGATAYRAARFGLQPIDARHRIAFRYFETGSPFEYDLVRLIYTERRKLDIAN